MNYGEIKNFDIANGEGVRVSLFVSGCTHHCKNCFNKETWDFNYGKPFTEETEELLLRELEPDYIDGLSLLGGEPFEPQNQAVLLPFLRRVKERYPKKKIWCYTGYLYDRDLLGESRARCEYTDEMLGQYFAAVPRLVKSADNRRAQVAASGRGCTISAQKRKNIIRIKNRDSFFGCPCFSLLHIFCCRVSRERLAERNENDEQRS